MYVYMNICTYIYPDIYHKQHKKAYVIHT